MESPGKGGGASSVTDVEFNKSFYEQAEEWLKREGVVESKDYNRGKTPPIPWKRIFCPPVEPEPAEGGPANKPDCDEGTGGSGVEPVVSPAEDSGSLSIFQRLMPGEPGRLTRSKSATGSLNWESDSNHGGGREKGRTRGSRMLRKLKVNFGDSPSDPDESGTPATTKSAAGSPTGYFDGFFENLRN